MMKASTATILFLSVHISSFRQIGMHYKAMILELYILHAVGRVCMAICQFQGAVNVHTEERIFAVDVFIIKYDLFKQPPKTPPSATSCDMFLLCEWNWLLDTCSCRCTATTSRGFVCLILMPAQDRTVSAVVTELNNIASVLDAGTRI